MGNWLEDRLGLGSGGTSELLWTAAGAAPGIATGNPWLAMAGASAGASFGGAQRQAAQQRESQKRQEKYYRELLERRRNSAENKRLQVLLDEMMASRGQRPEVATGSRAALEGLGSGQNAARAMTGMERRGVVQGAQAGSQALLSHLGATGTAGGLAAGALARQSAQGRGAMADVEARGLARERQYGIQDIDLMRGQEMLESNLGMAERRMTLQEQQANINALLNSLNTLEPNQNIGAQGYGQALQYQDPGSGIPELMQTLAMYGMFMGGGGGGGGNQNPVIPSEDILLPSTAPAQIPGYKSGDIGLPAGYY